MTTLEKGNTNFEAAIQFWKGVHLTALQQDLDEQGLAIVDNQKDGLVSRKKLAEQTRGKMKRRLYHILINSSLPVFRIQKDTR
jgi:hypothetical protein